MTRAEHHDLGSSRDLGGDGVHILGQARLGGPEVESGQRIERFAELGRLAGHESGQLVEDALDLRLFGDLRLAPRVAELDGHERLHEQRLAAAGGVMDDALHPAARVGPDRDDVPAAAQRHQRLLKGACNVAGVDQLIQAGA